MYSYRFRFGLREGDTLAIDSDAIEILTSGGYSWILKSAQRGTPISKHSSASIVCKSFRTEEEARLAGQACRDAMVAWAVSQRRGCNLGNDSSNFTATREALAQYELLHRAPVRNDIHGLDVYPSSPEPLFLRIEGQPTTTMDSEVLVRQLGQLLSSPPKLSRRETLAAELFAMSFLDSAVRSRFVMLVSAVEAVLEYRQHDTVVQEFVDETTLRLEQLSVPAELRNSLRGTLRWLRQESIGRAGRRLASELLPSLIYAQQSADLFFGKCYEVRSELVHKGGSELNPSELRNRCEWLALFVGDLLNQLIFGALNRPLSIITGVEHYSDGTVRWKTLE